MSTVYLNGEFIPHERALVSVDDRGFLFADGIYEVTPAFWGTFFRIERHVERMRRGLAELRIDFDPKSLIDVHRRLLAANDLEDKEAAIVYFQITRGVAPRAHAFPTTAVCPTVYGFAKELERVPRAVWEKGFTATTVLDRRWERPDIKTIGLLPNCLALQTALDDIESLGVSRVVCLGDVIGYGASPKIVAETTRKRCFHVLQGNHDAALLDDADMEGFNPRARKAIEWTRKALDPEDPGNLDLWDWFGALKASTEMEMPDAETIQLVHLD